MKSIDRLVKCYKTGRHFHIWEDHDDNGRYIGSTTCPHIYEYNGKRALCDGFNEYGLPCVYCSLS